MPLPNGSQSSLFTYAPRLTRPQCSCRDELREGEERLLAHIAMSQLKLASAMKGIQVDLFGRGVLTLMEFNSMVAVKDPIDKLILLIQQLSAKGLEEFRDLADVLENHGVAKDVIKSIRDEVKDIQGTGECFLLPGVVLMNIGA